MPDQFEFPEDKDRLPEGFKRIAYDSDTMKFTFRDLNGRQYQGEAGAEYGILTPISATLSHSRPNAFSSDSSSVSTPRRPPPKQKSTFKDILPPDLLTTSSLSEKTPDSPSRESTRSATAPRQKFVRAVRKSVLPKMQGVVLNLRRSVTSIRGNHPTFPTQIQELEHDETRGLVRSVSPSSSIDSSDIRRSTTMVTSRQRSKYPPS